MNIKGKLFVICKRAALNDLEYVSEKLIFHYTVFWYPITQTNKMWTVPKQYDKM